MRDIRDEEELKHLTSVLFWMTEAENPSPSELEDIERLGAAIEAYETEHYPLPHLLQDTQ